MELEGRSLLIKSQASHKDCPELIGAHYKDIDYNKIGQCRNKKCHNRTSRGGVSIGLYSPDSIVTYEEDGKTYCFTREDISRITKTKPYINPYTGRKISFSPEQKKQIYKQSISVNQPLNIDLIQLNENRLCPLFFSQHRNVGFTSLPHSDVPVTLKTIPSDYINVSMHLSPLLIKESKYLSASFESYPTELDIYKVNLSSKLLDNVHPSKEVLINIEDVTKISRVYDSDNDELQSKRPVITGDKKIFLGKDLVHKVSYIISASDDGEDAILSESDLLEFKKNRIVEDKYITLCKGVDFDKVIKNKNVRVGDRVFVKFNGVTLWNTNICTGLSEAMKYKYGAVILIKIPPSDILFDLRYVINFNISKIMLEPGIMEVEIKFITEGKSFSNIKRPSVSSSSQELPTKDSETSGGGRQNKPDIYDDTVSTINSIFK